VLGASGTVDGRKVTDKSDTHETSRNLQASTSTCPGCGLVLPAFDGPTHAYIGANASCWALFGELLLRRPGTLATDAYAVQHSGIPERRAIQSVGVHLIGLCLQLEHAANAERHAELLRRVLAQKPNFEWLEPPSPNGSITVVDVLGHDHSVEAWAHDVWQAWATHHPTVRAWLAAALG
jgi:Family of unknown function (DUF5946)